MTDLPTKPKRPKPGPKRNFSSEQARMNAINSYRKALRALVKTGGVSDPALATRIEQGWHPGTELAVMSIRPDLPDAIKTIILKTLLEHSFISETDQARLDAGFDGPAHISITIDSYAAGPQRTAIEPPRTDFDVIASDREVLAHRNSPATPEPAVEKYQTFDVVDGVAKPVTSESNPPATTVDDPVVITDGVGNTYTVKRSV
jgi:hypothetical protein